ncbi:MAG: hypothetical protein LBJ47_07500, partial [Tannerella sp.]|nr:hypothetical protein [Tannerella sp.]
DNASAGTFLLTPLLITGNAQFIALIPDNIQVLDSERPLFLQSNTLSGLVFVKVMYNNQIFSYLPVLINTPEGIEAWKENTKLMSCLKITISFLFTWGCLKSRDPSLRDPTPALQGKRGKRRKKRFVNILIISGSIFRHCKEERRSNPGAGENRTVCARIASPRSQ